MAIAGYKGQVRVSTNVAADVQKWSIDAEMDQLETTALNPGVNKTYIMGLFGASGTVEANFNMGDTLGQKALHDAFFARTSVTLNLDTDTSGTLRTYSGTAFISKVSTSVEVGGLSTITFDYVFTGAVTFA